jgi:16S rRNA U516 pseudouridylate synthase RsuA-like enzyme
MTRRKKKLSPEQKAAKKKRQKEYMTVFMNGKQKRVKRPPTIDGIPVDEFIRRNADPIWLHQNEMWEYIDQNEEQDDTLHDDQDIPFNE